MARECGGFGLPPLSPHHTSSKSVEAQFQLRKRGMPLGFFSRIREQIKDWENHKNAKKQAPQTETFD